MKFEKDPDGRWYAVIPSWTGDRAELEMVLGADILCEKLAKGKDEVNVLLTFDDEELKNPDAILKLEQIMPHPGSGADYYVESIVGETVDLDLWLCEVLYWLVKKYPKTIYIKIRNE